MSYLRHYGKATSDGIDLEIRGAHDLCYQYEDTLLVSQVADHESQMGGVSVYTRHGVKPLLEERSSYYGVAAMEDGAIAVRNGTTNKIEVYSRDNTRVSEFQLPSGKHKGIAVTQEGNILVCDSANDCIREYEVDGSLRRVIQNKAVKKPGYVATLDSSIIVTCAGHEPCVLKLTSAGKQIWKYKDIGFPQGISVDRNGDIYVCDAENKCIVMVTPDGAMSFKMISPGQLDNLMPFSVAVSRDKMAVQFMENNRIRTFRLT